MSTTTTQEKPQAETTNGNAPAPLTARSVEYKPMGETNAITLNVSMVRSFLAVKTAKGFEPNDQDVVKFLMLCKARELNPWVGDAYLIGYDSQQHGPTFSLITSVQALRKRAEAHPEYNGMESGVRVLKPKVEGEEQQWEDRAGDFVFPGEQLIGAWARCHRKDRGFPEFDAINLKTFQRGTAIWRNDPAGMLVKCAEASVLRSAFPSQTSGLYIDGEMSQVAAPAFEAEDQPKLKATRDLNQELAPERSEVAKAATKARESREMSEPVHSTADVDPEPDPEPEATTEPQGDASSEEVTQNPEAGAKLPIPADLQEALLSATAIGQVESIIRQQFGAAIDSLPTAERQACLDAGERRKDEIRQRRQDGGGW